MTSPPNLDHPAAPDHRTAASPSPQPAVFWKRLSTMAMATQMVATATTCGVAASIAVATRTLLLHAGYSPVQTVLLLLIAASVLGPFTIAFSLDGASRDQITLSGLFGLAFTLTVAVLGWITLT